MSSERGLSKISWEEVLSSCIVFYNDLDVEDRYNRFIEEKAREIREANYGHREISKDDVLRFIMNENDGLERILGILRLSQEKFFRIISLLRKQMGIYISDWTNIDRITREITAQGGDNPFGQRVLEILMYGYKDPELERDLPELYRERLHLTSLNEYIDEWDLRLKLKDSYSATYYSWKGTAIEDRIRRQIESADATYAKGRSSIVDVTVDWMIPNAIDPRIIIMATYQETTSSNQSVKARDMMHCYEAIQHENMQRGERRIFINFADGGGWLARRKDLSRLHDACHYFLNLKHLNQLNEIIRTVI